MQNQVGIGKQDFAALRESQCFYIDKTDFIRQWWNYRDDVTACDSLNYLCRYLEHAYGKKVIILLDEYDTPMQEANVYGYWEEMTSFLRNLFHATFKTNACMERAVMTGITRVSKESMFSDLNNLNVVTTTSNQYTLSITNLETVSMFSNMFKGWFECSLSNYNGFVKALFQGDVEAMNYYMNKISMATFSYFDVGSTSGNDTEPERFYHGFVLGLMADQADIYEIKSNRESGFGRYDVMMIPRKAQYKKYPALWVCV